MENRWIIKTQPEELVAEICAYSKLPELAVRVLINNGLTEKRAVSAYLNSNTKFLHDPFLLTGMDKAVDRIKKAIFQNEKIAVYGDYDVDGVTSCALVFLYLTGKGADISYYIPDRADEGYGINTGAIDKLAANGVTLLITVDSGITAATEIKHAKEKGIDVIVTDHHECKEVLPECIAVINPKISGSPYPYQGLAGVGVAFKLICALEGSENAGTLLNHYGDLVALGTIADVMPLTDENRIIVTVGLSKFNKRQVRTGLLSLMDAAGIICSKTVNAATIGYQLAPRINAAGRIGSAGCAVELLTAENREKADALALELCDSNCKRQETEAYILKEALELFEKIVDRKKDKVAVLAHEGWHHGIIGIVASRITDKMHLPTILISVENGEGKGSGRSIKGFNLFEALTDSSELLLRFGGHELAAGLTVSADKLEDFRTRISGYAKAHITDEMQVPTLTADGAFSIDTLSLDDALTIRRFEPFGVGNHMPIFYGDGLTITCITSISEGKHTKFCLKGKTAELTAIWFSQKFEEFHYQEGQKVDVLCHIDINEFRGAKKLQLLIKDIRISGNY